MPHTRPPSRAKACSRCNWRCSPAQASCRACTRSRTPHCRQQRPARQHRAPLSPTWPLSLRKGHSPAAAASLHSACARRARGTAWPLAAPACHRPPSVRTRRWRPPARGTHGMGRGRREVSELGDAHAAWQRPTAERSACSYERARTSQQRNSTRAPLLSSIRWHRPPSDRAARVASRCRSERVR